MADHLLQCIVGSAGSSQQRIAGAQHGKEGYPDGMGTGDDTMPDQGVLRPHNIRQDLVQRIPPPVTAAIAGGRNKMAFTDPVTDIS